MSNLAEILGSYGSQIHTDDKMEDDLQVVYVGTVTDSVDGRGPSRQVGVFANKEVAQRWVDDRPAGRTFVPMAVITDAVFDNHFDIAEELEQQEKDLAELQERIRARRKLVDLLDKLS